RALSEHKTLSISWDHYPLLHSARRHSVNKNRQNEKLCKFLKRNAKYRRIGKYIVVSLINLLSLWKSGNRMARAMAYSAKKEE
ncbi:MULTISPECIES: hypothetical protein, partial [Pantoea]